MSQIRCSDRFTDPLADRLDASLADPADERACILVLIEGGIRAAIVAAGLDEALAEVRRRRAQRTGAACAQLQVAA
ncbi:hypothetical protein [Enterovirga rhinocerotis]|uniref:Uncharacterized protein n=1 Tax=Enterovirga rhinocerotis TaxID=1339210 RepID=A0A4R7C7M6_9HYPH|nr:hypothetical protein [Enterovirga rhinocerotis]TDR94173.1 hypothetical protein EV668_1450 [Enterovirga rhinocerotis]